jgi:hypothetical protein
MFAVAATFFICYVVATAISRVCFGKRGGRRGGGD